MVTRRTLLGGAGAAALSAATGLRQASAQTKGAPVRGGSLTWGVETEPSTLNPHLNGQAKAKLVLRNAYETLLARTPDGGYVPWLAKDYAISEDGRTYTFTLRDDVTFHDGEKLDAAAVALNFAKLKEPTYSGSISAGHVSHVSEAIAVDARTLVLKLSRVYAPFLDGAAGIEILSLSKAFSLPGWRIAFAVGNAAMVGNLLRLKTNVDSGMFTALQHAAIALLDSDPAERRALAATYQRRRDLVCDALAAAGLTVARPRGGMYIWLALPGDEGSLAFSERVLDACDVVVSPGVAYGPAGEGFVRLALTLPEDRLAEAVERLIGAL